MRNTGKLERVWSIQRCCLVVSLLLVIGMSKSAMTEEMSTPSMPPCPESPNCVSSDAKDDVHKINPFLLEMPAPKGWKILRELVLALPRTRIVKETDAILQVECRSLIFRFVDDLELHLDVSQGIVSVRSASRSGHSDFGVNRRRIESLRDSLSRRKVLRASNE